jgi:4'-phosphopantetheinyl transferase
MSIQVSTFPEPCARTPGPLQLGGQEVQVWRLELDTVPSDGWSWENLLSADERERAGRFHFARDRRRFTAARGLLRTLLGGYLQADPGELRFRYSHKGKPALDGKHQESGLCFNVSHSDEVALLAFARAGELGVDVERVRQDCEVQEIAQRFFSSAEQKALAALPAAQQYRAFFNCWTRKEAFVKAKGGGLSLPLDQFDVSLAPGEPAELLATRPDPAEKQRWSLWALDAGEEYAAALIVAGSGLRVTCTPWRTP